jgi:hypothetical protein
MACCPFVKNCGRWQVNATTQATGAQYYRIYTSLCKLLSQSKVIMDIVSTGSTTTDEASLVTNCGGLIPLYTASTLAPVTVAQLPAGTSIEVVVKT